MPPPVIIGSMITPATDSAISQLMVRSISLAHSMVHAGLSAQYPHR